MNNINILLQYYNFINYEKIDDYHFKVKDDVFFITKNTKDILNDYLKLYNLKYSLFNFPIKNIYGSIYTIVDNIVYIVFFTDYKIYQKIDMKQIIKLSSYYMFDMYINFYELWNSKIKYLLHYNGFSDYIFTFFYGIAINSIKLVTNVDFKQLSYGICFKEYNFLKILEYLNFLNFNQSATMRNYSMFIKYNFFINNKKSDLYFINFNHFSINDYYFFLCRLIFPDLYFYYFSTIDIDLFLNKYYSYILYVKEIIQNIKKVRKIDISNFSYFINLL